MTNCTVPSIAVAYHSRTAKKYRDIIKKIFKKVYM